MARMNNFPSLRGLSDQNAQSANRLLSSQASSGTPLEGTASSAQVGKYLGATQPQTQANQSMRRLQAQETQKPQGLVASAQSAWPIKIKGSSTQTDRSSAAEINPRDGYSMAMPRGPGARIADAAMGESVRGNGGSMRLPQEGLVPKNQDLVSGSGVTPNGKSGVGFAQAMDDSIKYETAYADDPHRGRLESGLGYMQRGLARLGQTAMMGPAAAITNSYNWLTEDPHNPIAHHSLLTGIQERSTKNDVVVPNIPEIQQAMAKAQSQRSALQTQAAQNSSPLPGDKNYEGTTMGQAPGAQPQGTQLQGTQQPALSTQRPAMDPYQPAVPQRLTAEHLINLATSKPGANNAALAEAIALVSQQNGGSGFGAVEPQNVPGGSGSSRADQIARLEREYELGRPDINNPEGGYMGMAGHQGLVNLIPRGMDDPEAQMFRAGISKQLEALRGQSDGADSQQPFGHASAGDSWVSLRSDRTPVDPKTGQSYEVANHMAWKDGSLVGGNSSSRGGYVPQRGGNSYDERLQQQFQRGEGEHRPQGAVLNGEPMPDHFVSQNEKNSQYRTKDGGQWQHSVGGRPFDHRYGDKDAGFAMDANGKRIPMYSRQFSPGIDPTADQLSVDRGEIPAGGYSKGTGTGGLIYTDMNSKGQHVPGQQGAYGRSGLVDSSINRGGYSEQEAANHANKSPYYVQSQDSIQKGLTQPDGKGGQVQYGAGGLVKPRSSEDMAADAAEAQMMASWQKDIAQNSWNAPGARKSMADYLASKYQTKTQADTNRLSREDNNEYKRQKLEEDKSWHQQQIVASQEAAAASVEAADSKKSAQYNTTLNGIFSRLSDTRKDQFEEVEKAVAKSGAFTSEVLADPQAAQAIYDQAEAQINAAKFNNKFHPTSWDSLTNYFTEPRWDEQTYNPKLGTPQKQQSWFSNDNAGEGSYTETYRKAAGAQK